MQFGLQQVAAFISSPICYFTDEVINVMYLLLCYKIYAFAFCQQIQL